MATKLKRITSALLIGLPTLVLIMGGVAKILGKEPETVMQFLTKTGFGSCIEILGLSELLIAALLIYPKTLKVGFLFAICYFSGAFSLELSGGIFPASTLFIALLWIGMFVKEKAMFLPRQEDVINSTFRSRDI
ncbi:hypothetical protein CNR22_14695 [Sphingobacteriaceae bacterium]|nr:hypothetical protein CNR22_14695 [Sphingobacteriaceae bacterium]